MAGRKRISISLLLCALAFAFLVGCSGRAASVPENSADDGRIKVVATIFPQYDFVREIAQEHVDLTLLLPPGTECHSFEPTPQDILTIQNCDVFIYVGGDFDDWTGQVLGSMDTGLTARIALMDLVDLLPRQALPGMQADGGDEHEHASVYDEHVWTSPRNAAAIVQALCDTLCDVDPDNADSYRQRTTEYLGELDALDAAFTEAVQHGSRKTLVFGDRFPFAYLDEAYGLECYAAFAGCSTSTSASAGTIASLVDIIRAQDIPYVFTIELSSGQIAQTLCEETGAQMRMLHSCQSVSRDEMAEGASYLSLMWQNVETLKEALI